MASQEHKESPKTPSIQILDDPQTNVDPLYKYISEAILKVQSLDLNLSSSDTILCSFPKSGTTWLKALAFSISTRAQFDLNQPKKHPLFSSNPHKLVPFLEFELTQNDEALQNPDNVARLLSTHIQYQMFPKSVLDSKSKIVYICRNPKDAMVSLYHFTRKLPDPDHRSFLLETAFQFFCSGAISPYGDYWNHVLGFYEASLAYPEKVLFLKYEDMMFDGLANVKKLAEFMGYPFSEQEEKEGVVEKINEMCSFGSLSNLEVNKSCETTADGGINGKIGASNSSFYRKGEVGDWKNCLTEEMSKKIDEITKKKLADRAPRLNIMY